MKKVFTRFSFEHFFLYFRARMIKYHPLSYGEHHNSFLKWLLYVLFFPSCLSWSEMEGKSSGRAPIECKKENIRLPNNNLNVKNVWLKTFDWQNVEFVSFKNSKKSKIRITWSKFLHWTVTVNLFDLHNFSNYMGSNYRSFLARFSR